MKPVFLILSVILGVVIVSEAIIVINKPVVPVPVVERNPRLINPGWGWGKWNYRSGCARVSCAPGFCGGYSRGTGGSCHSVCNSLNYQWAYCQQKHCLCHSGKDLGRQCVRYGGYGWW